MLAFLESPRFNIGVRYGTSGGPEFSTEVVAVTSGAEQRNVNWDAPRGRWQVGQDVYNRVEIDALTAFFRDRMGRAGAFRYKDWSDWYTEHTTGVLRPITGSSTTMQLAKKYVNGSNTSYRPIRKPVPSTVVIKNAGGSIVTPTAIDYTTGIVTITAGTYTWAGEFDVPVRFDSDKFDITFEAYRDSDKEALFTVNGLSVVELL